MDEPLSNLDAKLRVVMRAELSKLHMRLQTTVIYVTHDQTEAMTMGDRIVVQKDGVIQQVGAPLEIYDNPDNMFVAGFIGTPPMNFIDAVLVKEGDDLFVKGAGFKLKVPQGRFKDLSAYIDKEVVFGIRPEDADFYPGEITDDNSIVAMVDVSEPLGSEVILYLSFGESMAVAKVDPHTRARDGEDIKIVFAMHKMHLFDKETELVIK
jgi:multiple sugar transport system ATP-binding protein